MDSRIPDLRFTFDFINDSLNSRNHSTRRKLGRPRKYSDAILVFVMLLKVKYNLKNKRQTSRHIATDLIQKLGGGFKKSGIHVRKVRTYMICTTANRFLKSVEKNKDNEHIGEGERRTEKAQQSSRNVSGRRVIDKTCGDSTDRHKRGVVNRKKVS